MVEHEHLSGIQALSQLCNLPVSKIDKYEVAHLYALESSDMPYPIRMLIANETGLLGKYILPPTKFLDIFTNDATHEEALRLFQERRARFHHYAESILHLAPQALSYGLQAPSYRAALLAYRKETKSGEAHKSLLIGALTIDTVQEYETVVHGVFPEAQTAIIDLEGVETKKGNNFSFASGLSTPFASNTFDTVHTNSILHHLEGALSDRKNRIQLFQEAYRILRPGGMLIMVEANLPWIYEMAPKKIPEQIRIDFDRAGLPSPTIRLATNFKSREGMSKWLMDMEHPIWFATEKNNETFEIILKK